MNKKRSLSPMLLGIVTVFALVLVGCQDGPRVKSSTPSLLYVLIAKDAEIVKVPAGYELNFKRSNIQIFLGFSDRPLRLSHMVESYDLNQSWRLGKKSFESYPPTATITMNGVSQTVVLQGMEVRKNQINFSLSEAGGVPIKSMKGNHAVLFIDAGTLVLNGRSNNFNIDSGVSAGIVKEYPPGE